MRFDAITIFPEIFQVLRSSKIWTRAEEAKRIEFQAHDLRDYTDDRHRTVDDVPYGGGAGMVMKVEPLVRAVEAIATLPGRKVLYASPQGRPLTHEWALELTNIPQMVVICGRYEGVDERFVEGWVDDSFSIGDYVLSGGELPAMVLFDTIARLIPGVVGDSASVANDSFACGGLKHPQYTRPPEFRGRIVPEVLRSGNHEQIEKWRKEMTDHRTRLHRPDLMVGSKVGKRTSV